MTVELGEQATQELFDNIHKMWVEPEIARRRAEGRLDDDFKIRRCLIRIPADHEPIVDFNDEINWHAKATTPEGQEFVIGKPVYLEQIERIDTVCHPTYEGNRVPFFFLYWTGVEWKLAFDGSPSSPAPENPTDAAKEWEIGKAIAEHYNDILKELSLHSDDTVQAEIQDLGLWPAPGILPYPYSSICECCRKGELEEARKILVDYCTPDFIEGLVRSWQGVAAFDSRSALLQEATSAHSNKHYTLSVSSLIPHIEGMITDWIYNNAPSAAVPWRQESKTKKFRDLVTDGASRTFVEHTIAEAVVSFIVDGPVLDSFEDWLSPLSRHFPNRHMVGHGNYDPSLYTEESSIKVFLLLDTLYQIMKPGETTDRFDY